ncbi:hypothetical protein Syun_008765 [Stephania yunnanensis]|uniref:Uncharacterized protein n=1 Tax=Stephania yunnanensis TaxID=152371 RepID=A0AAP0KD58_9MAGN
MRRRAAAGDILRAATTGFDQADGGARTAEGRRKDRGRGAQLRPTAARDRQRRRGTDRGGEGPTSRGEGCVQRRLRGVQPAAATACLGGGGSGGRRGGGSGVGRGDAGDLALSAATHGSRATSAATVQRRCSGGAAGLRRWRRQVSGGGGGLAVKMEMVCREVKMGLEGGKNGFGGWKWFVKTI